jgi:uncharacterized paraquat-inducible protein A
MPIVFACTCGRQLSVPDAAASLRARCPRCGATVRVPAATEARPDTLSSGSWVMLVKKAKAKRPTGS